MPFMYSKIVLYGVYSECMTAGNRCMKENENICTKLTLLAGPMIFLQ